MTDHPGGSLLSLTIPGVPRGKGRPRFFRHGNHVQVATDAKTQTAENWIRACALDAKLNAERFDSPLTLWISFYLPRPKKPVHRDAPAGRPDLDNLVKTVLDGFNLAGLWADDARVCEVHARKLYAEPGQERTEVHVYAWVAAAPASSQGTAMQRSPVA